MKYVSKFVKLSLKLFVSKMKFFQTRYNQNKTSKIDNKCAKCQNRSQNFESHALDNLVIQTGFAKIVSKIEKKPSKHQIFRFYVSKN